jgi:hypothetical protein
MAREHVRLRMDADLLQRVDAAAERENRTRSNMIEVLVRVGLIEQGSGPADDVFTALESVTGAGGVDLAAVQQEAIKPTLDERRASSSRSGPAGIETLPKPHRHRFQIEVANTRRGKAGRQVADYACDCGQIKKEIPVR